MLVNQETEFRSQGTLAYSVERLAYRDARYLIHDTGCLMVEPQITTAQVGTEKVDF